MRAGTVRLILRSSQFVEIESCSEPSCAGRPSSRSHHLEKIYAVLEKGASKDANAFSTIYLTAHVMAVPPCDGQRGTGDEETRPGDYFAHDSVAKPQYERTAAAAVPQSCQPGLESRECVSCAY